MNRQQRRSVQFAKKKSHKKNVHTKNPYMSMGKVTFGWAIFYPRKHTICTYAHQKREAKKRKKLRAKSKK